MVGAHVGIKDMPDVYGAAIAIVVEKGRAPKVAPPRSKDLVQLPSLTGRERKSR
jgi:hypothetical protein